MKAPVSRQITVKKKSKMFPLDEKEHASTSKATLLF